MPEGHSTASEKINVRKYRHNDDTALLDLLDLQIASGESWPSKAVQESWDLLEWMALHSSLSRWVAFENKGNLVGHAGTSSITPGPKADYWATLINIDPARLAEVSRLLVSPTYRRSGISGLLTRRCIRETVEKGRVPVATANPSSKNSLNMMLKFGWKVKGSLYSNIAKRELVYLVPPQKLIDAALDKPAVTVS